MANLHTRYLGHLGGWVSWHSWGNALRQHGDGRRAIPGGGHQRIGHRVYRTYGGRYHLVRNSEGWVITITVTLIQNPALTIALVFPTATIVLSIIRWLASILNL